MLAHREGEDVGDTRRRLVKAEQELMSMLTFARDLNQPGEWRHARRGIPLLANCSTGKAE